MTNATTFNQLNETLQAVEPLCNQSIVERIDASKPLAVVTGIAASSLAFTATFGLGICAGALLEPVLKASMPIETLAIGCTAFAFGFMILTMKAGVQNDVVRALSYGSAGAFVLGTLGAAIGI